MKNLTILSGKGGVGKSSITASLGIILSKKSSLVLADCDVDAPNLALVFGKEEKDFEEWTNISTRQKAVFDLKKCNSCKKCYNACHFGAIEWKDNHPQLKKFGCEGCGIAEMICPVGAIKLKNVNNAKIGYVRTKYGFNIVSAQLNAGESGSGKLVAEVKNKAKEVSENLDLMITDSAAGIGCPVIASVSGSDFCLLVTEPTPSGFYDMKKAFEIVNHFQIKSGLIINKFDLNKNYGKKIKRFAKKKNISLLGEIPYSQSFTRALVEMQPVIEIDKKNKKIFEDIAKKIVL
jgi:MinD superfamily P-loop ATPase